MSRARVPQADLSAGPLSVLSTPLPPTNQPTTAGTLAGILSGGIDAATRAVGFMGAVESVKAREAIISYRANQDAIRESERYAAQVAEMEEKNADEIRGNFRRKAAEDFAIIGPMIEAGKIPVPDTMDPQAIADAAEERINSLTVGMGEIGGTAYAETMRDNLRGAFTKKAIAKAEVVTGERISDLTVQAATLQDYESFQTLLNRDHAMIGKTNRAVAETVADSVVSGMAEVGDRRYPSFSQAIANPLRRKELDAKYQTAIDRNDAETNRIMDGVFTFRAYRQLEPSATLQPDLDAAFSAGQLTAEKYKTYTNELRARDEKAEREARELADTERANTQAAYIVGQQKNLFDSGRSWAVAPVEVKVGDKTVKMSVDEQRDAWFADRAAIVTQGVQDPVEREARLIELAKTGNFVPKAWQAQSSAAAQRFMEVGSGVSSATTGEAFAVTPDMEAALNRYAMARSTNPAYAQDMAGGEKNSAVFDSILEHRQLNGNGSLRDALASWNASRRTGARPQEPVNLVENLMDILGSEGSDNFTAQSNIVNAELRRLVGIKTAMGMSPARATEESVAAIKDRQIDVNGYSTFVVNRNYMPEKRMFRDMAEKWIDGVATDLAGVNIVGDKPLSKENVRLDQDKNTGLWRLIDTRTGQMLNFGDRSNVKRVAFTTQELMSVLRAGEPTPEQRSEAARQEAVTAQQRRAKMNDYSAKYNLGVPPDVSIRY